MMKSRILGLAAVALGATALTLLPVAPASAGSVYNFPARNCGAQYVRTSITHTWGVTHTHSKSGSSTTFSWYKSQGMIAGTDAAWPYKSTGWAQIDARSAGFVYATSQTCTS